MHICTYLRKCIKEVCKNGILSCTYIHTYIHICTYKYCEGT